MKLLVILTGSVLIFHETITSKRLAGMVLAFVGIVYYTHVKIMGNAKKEGWDKQGKSTASEVELGKKNVVMKA